MQLPASGSHTGAACGQATALLHWPLALQASKSLPESTEVEQRVAFGAHGAHAPSRHTGVLPEQGAPTFCHVPEHICGCCPLHDSAPTEQPASAPPSLAEPLLPEPEPLPPLLAELELLPLSEPPEPLLEGPEDDDPLDKVESTPPSSPLPLPAIVQSLSSAGQPASTTGSANTSLATDDARLIG